MHIPVPQLPASRSKHLARAPLSDRIAVVDLARIPIVDLVRIYVKIGLLPKLEGSQCTSCKSGCLQLTTRRGQGAPRTICGFQLPELLSPILRCDYRRCSKRCFNLDPEGPLDELFGNVGNVNPARTLLAIAHVLSAHGAHYESSYELACQVGVSIKTAERVARVLRNLQAEAGREEQDSFAWPKGSLVEADEASMRVHQVPCKAGCKLVSCGTHELGRYRLLHRRFMCVMPRGRRDLAVYHELPPETCAAGGAGVPLGGKECDAFLPWALGPKGSRHVLLTDGAAAYQSVAPRDRLAYHTPEHEPNQFSMRRFVKYYKHLKLSHGVVSHSAEQWAVVDRVRILTPDGKLTSRKLKKGTQCVDGLWPEMRGAIPHGVHTADWPRCQSYIWSWVWRSRRQGCDLFKEFGAVLRKLRKKP